MCPGSDSGLERKHENGLRLNMPWKIKQIPVLSRLDHSLHVCIFYVKINKMQLGNDIPKNNPIKRIHKVQLIYSVQKANSKRTQHPPPSSCLLNISYLQFVSGLRNLRDSEALEDPETPSLTSPGIRLLFAMKSDSSTGKK